MNTIRSTMAFALCAALLSSCGGIAQVGVGSKTDTAANTGVMFNTTDGVAVGYSGLVKYTDDGGKTWAEGTNQSMCLYAAAAIDAERFVAAGNSGNVVRTADGGKTWTHMTPIPGSRGRSVSFADGERGWVSTKSWLGETVDGGTTWTPLTLPDGVKKIETIACAAPGNGYLLSDAGVLYRTADGGTSWETLSEPFKANAAFKPVASQDLQIASVRFAGDAGVMAVIGTTGKDAVLQILTTADAGKTWADAGTAKQKAVPVSVSVSPDNIVSVFTATSLIASYKL